MGEELRRPMFNCLFFLSTPMVSAQLIVPYKTEDEPPNAVLFLQMNGSIKLITELSYERKEQQIYKKIIKHQKTNFQHKHGTHNVPDLNHMCGGNNSH